MMQHWQAAKIISSGENLAVKSWVSQRWTRNYKRRLNCNALWAQELCLLRQYSGLNLWEDTEIALWESFLHASIILALGLKGLLAHCEHKTKNKSLDHKLYAIEILTLWPFYKWKSIYKWFYRYVWLCWPDRKKIFIIQVKNKS